MTVNREIKSSVFTDLFGDDELVGKKNFLSLYNAIHYTDLKLEETQMERKIIPQSLYKTFSTDVSMEINGKIIVFVEHQSTLNNNMPLRFLEYFVHILYGIVPAKARYKKSIYNIPSPEFYVLYNGADPMPKEFELKLSDAYKVKQKIPQCELTVKVVNIGGKEGFKLPIVQNCDILKQYCKFIEAVFQKEASLKPDCTKEDVCEALEQAIKECITKGILSDYLVRKSTEVMNMFLGEYNYDDDVAAQREEAMEEGIEEGAHNKAVENAVNFLKMNLLTVEQIAQGTGLPLEEVQKLADNL